MCEGLKTLIQEGDGGITEKFDFQGLFHRKSREDCLKMGVAWTVCRFKGGLGNEPIFCFKMMLPYILNLIENKKMWLTIIFWCFTDTAFQRKKSEILQLTRSKVRALTSEQDIAAGKSIWPTYPSYLEQALYQTVKKGVKHKDLSTRS